MLYLSLRREIIRTCIRMNELGINQGTSGNASVRVREGLIITPTGMPYEDLSPDDLVLMDLDGEAAPGQRLPSSEWRFHRDVYRHRPDAGVVLHSHAMFCTTLACLHRDIPPFHYMVAAAGGDSIRCAPYATFGTQALSDHALGALEGRRACLLANHGLLVLGPNLKKALTLAVEVEALAAQYWRALAVGEPKLLDREEMARVLEKFENYGRQTAVRGDEE